MKEQATYPRFSLNDVHMRQVGLLYILDGRLLARILTALLLLLLLLLLPILVPRVFLQLMAE